MQYAQRSRFLIPKYSYRPIRGTVHGGSFFNWLKKTGRRMFGRALPHIQKAAPSIIPALFSSNEDRKREARDMIRRVGRTGSAALFDEAYNVGKEELSRGIEKLPTNARNIARSIRDSSIDIADEQAKKIGNRIRPKFGGRSDASRLSTLYGGIAPRPPGVTPMNPSTYASTPVERMVVRDGNFVVRTTGKPNHPISSTSGGEVYSKPIDAVVGGRAERSSTKKKGGSIRGAMAPKMKKEYARKNPSNKSSERNVPKFSKNKHQRKTDVLELSRRLKHGGRSSERSSMTEEDFINNARVLEFI